MKHDVTYWYQKYETYLQTLAADIPESSGSLPTKAPRSTRPPQLTLDEFQEMWRLILLDSELTERWVRHLTDGYETDKANVLTLLENALSAVPRATRLSQGPLREPFAA
jgi:hypothetical protein